MRRSAVWLLLASTGCFANPSADPASPGEGPAAPTTPVDGPTTEPEAEPACRIEATPLRRLSHFEYTRTLEDLFSDVELPAIDLPLDPRPHEFTNDAAALQPSVTLLEGYLEIAEQIAARATPSRLTCAPDSPEAEAACARAFVAEQGRLLFRRPLSAQEVETYAAMFDDAPAEASFTERAQLTLQLMLTAPEFLYRFERARAPVAPGESGPLDAYSLATRLSYFLWGSTPDAALLDAAEAGRLDTPEGLRAEAERLLAHPKAREAFVHVFGQWLELDRIEYTTKIEEDGLDAQLRAAMREESERFAQRLFEGGGVQELLTSERTEVNPRLAEIYGVPPPAEGWAEVTLTDRAGILGQASFLASHAHPDKPSPVLRGVFLLDRILCMPPGAPPPNAEAMGVAAADEVEGPLTNRELYELMTAADGCRACHDTINPAGFAFESFDTMGRFRAVEPNGLEVDTSGQLGAIAFRDARDLVTQLAADPRVEACATKKWLRYAFAGGPVERQACVLEAVQQSARAAGGGFRDTMLAIVTHPAFSTLTVPAEAP